MADEAQSIKLPYNKSKAINVRVYGESLEYFNEFKNKHNIGNDDAINALILEAKEKCQKKNK